MVLPLDGPPAEAWDHLALQARNVFATHAWASAWWAEYGEGGTPVVLTDDPADPRVVLPLYVRGRALRQARWIGHGPADLLTPACAPQDRHRAAPLLQAAVDDGRLPADVVLLQDCPVDDPWWSGSGVRTISTEVSPVLRVEPGLGWDAWLAGRSKNFRSQAKRKPARLEREHDVVVRLATAETLEDDLEALFRLHSARWDGVSPLLEDRQRRFTASFAATALQRGWLRLWVLDLDGRTACVLLTFRFGPDAYCYLFGREPSLDRESVGFVLLVHAVRDALDSGAAEFRFLRGDEQYKSRFADDEGGIGTFAMPRTVRGRAAVAVARRRRRAARPTAEVVAEEPAPA